MAGCSAEGIITSAGAIEDPFAVAVALLQSDDVRFHLASATGMKADSVKVGRELAASLQPYLGKDALSMFVVLDGLTVNFDALLSGFSEGAPKDFLPIFGGTASDNWTFENTYQYIGDEVLSDSVVAVLFSGPGRFVHAVNHGCVPIGAERKVTRSEGNIIWEIDGKPALDVMREYIDIEKDGDWRKAIVNLAIGFKAPGDFASTYDEYLIRFVPQKDDDKKWIGLPTTVEQGTSIWMTRRDYEKISDGLDRTAKQLNASLPRGRPRSLLPHRLAHRPRPRLALLPRRREGEAHRAAARAGRPNDAVDRLLFVRRDRFGEEDELLSQLHVRRRRARIARSDVSTLGREDSPPLPADARLRDLEVSNAAAR